MFQGCIRDVSRVLQRCCNGDFRNVLRVFQRCFKECFKGFQGSFKGVWWLFQGCFNGVPGIFKGVSMVFQGWILKIGMSWMKKKVMEVNCQKWWVLLKKMDQKWKIQCFCLKWLKNIVESVRKFLQKGRGDYWQLSHVLWLIKLMFCLKLSKNLVSIWRFWTESLKHC